MSASRRSASWPQLVAISLIGIGVASCSVDSGRFNEGFGSSNPPAAHGDVTGSIESSHVESRPLPQVASADQGTRQTIRRIARDNPGARIVVTGCYATRRPDEVSALPGVEQVVVNDDKPRLMQFLRRPEGTAEGAKTAEIAAL